MNVNWSVVAVVLSAIAIIVSLTILQGQTNSRIDGANLRVDTVIANVGEAETRLSSKIDGARAEVLAEVRALRDDLNPRSDLTAIRGELSAIKALLE